MKEHFEGKKALITGGLGFIGSHLAKRLVGLGAEVVVVDSLIPEYGGNLFNIAGFEKKIKVDIADVRDEHSMNYLIKGQHYLFNLAGQTSHMDSMQNPFTDLDINCRSQLSILEACRHHNPGIKVVFASTRQIYGKPDYLPVDEKHICRPVDVNGINKMAGEWYHILYNNVYGIRATALRLTNTIGPGMRIKDSRQTFVGIWIKNLIEAKPIEVWGGEQLRDFTDVEDAVDAFLLAATSDRVNGHAFNLGGIKPITLKNLAELLVKLNGGGEVMLRTFPPDHKRIDIGDYYANFGSLKAFLNWEPKVSMEDSIKKTIAFYKKNIQHYL